MKIQASDSGSPPKTALVQATITVGDENDNAPVIASQAAPFTVTENAASGTEVGVVSATDADAGLNGQFAFSLSAGNTDGAFEINVTSGRITVKGNVDREKANSYRLTVKATDKGTPEMASTEVFVVNVNDVNDNAPVFNKTKYEGRWTFSLERVCAVLFQTQE